MPTNKSKTPNLDAALEKLGDFAHEIEIGRAAKKDIAALEERYAMPERVNETIYGVLSSREENARSIDEALEWLATAIVKAAQ